jgi:transmembrane sensor
MEDPSERIIILLNFFAEDRINRRELDELLGYIAESRHNEPLHAFMLSEWESIDTSKPFPEPDWTAMLNAITHSPKGSIPVYKRMWPRIAVAASILLALSAGGYFFLHKQPVQVAQNQEQDIAPGHNQATLTLANGNKIILTKGLNGKLAQQGNTAITVNAGNAIAYQSQQTTADAVIQYNTLSTARGEQSPYPLILPDGSKAWLNASSSITFPTTFAGNDRTVTVTGEAYFEVVHNSEKPFRVKIKDQTIQDIGTHFNINGYDDEPAISTTLIEGSVKVYTNTATAILKPGQQSNSSNGHIKVAQVDPDDAIAWKNGFFEFKDANIQAVMRQLGRWYDVDVQYEGSIPTNQFSGEMERSLNASQALKLLSHTKVHFRIEGKKIIVTP